MHATLFWRNVRASFVADPNKAMAWEKGRAKNGKGVLCQAGLNGDEEGNLACHGTGMGQLT